MPFLLRGLCLLLLPLKVMAAPELISLGVGGISGQFGYSETELEIVMQDVLNKKLAHYGVIVNLTLYPNKAKLDAAYRKEEIDAIFSDPVVALKHDITYNKGAFLNLHYQSSPRKDKLLVLTSKKSGIKSLKQLKNKKVTFYADNRLEQTFLETVLLRNKLGTMDRFFAKKLSVKNGHLALLNVFFGKTDVTVVPEEVLKTAGELNPQLKKNLVVLAKSDPMCTRVVMVRGRPEYAKIFNDFMNDGKFLSRSANTIHLMTYEPTSFDELNSVRDLVSEHQQLKGSN